MRDAVSHVHIEVLVQVFLKGRLDPVQTPTELVIPLNGIIKTAHDVSEFCMDVLQGDLDSKGTVTLVLSDTRGDRRLFLVDQIQHIIVLAPDLLPEELTSE